MFFLSLMTRCIVVNKKNFEQLLAYVPPVCGAFAQCVRLKEQQVKPDLGLSFYEAVVGQFSQPHWA